MTQPLNYTPKAIEQLMGYECPHAPQTAAGLRYLIGKLREAQVFVLADHGQLLDRSKPRPEVPGLVLKPAYPVVALEYTAVTNDWGDGYYDGAKCSRRIALAWDWQDDLPPQLESWAPLNLGAGVVVASISYFDERQEWMPIAAAMHLAYDDPWHEPGEPTPFLKAAVASGRINPGSLGSRKLGASPIGLMPEGIRAAVTSLGNAAQVFDALTADTMDEINAYTDLCYALACKNVSTREYPAPANLNRGRIKAGKLPLKGFHVLELAGGAGMPGERAPGARGASRSHLRRGHIRRLAADRVTWVNSAIVRGRGFVDKVYAA